MSEKQNEVKKIRKTASEILSFDDRPLHDFHVKEWDTDILCKTPDAETMASIEQSCRDEDGKLDSLDYTTKVIYSGTFSKEGAEIRPFFSPGQIAELKKKNAKPIMKLFKHLTGEDSPK